MSQGVAMGNASSQPEPYGEGPDGFRDIVANGTTDPNVSKPTKRKRDVEPEPKQKTRKHRKSDSQARVKQDQQGIQSPASATTVQPPPSPSQPTPNSELPAKKSQKSRKQKNKDIDTPVPAHPSDTVESHVLESLASATTVQPPPSPSQPAPNSELPVKKAQKSRKQKYKDADMPDSTNPRDTAVAEEPSAAEHTTVAEQTPAPYSPSPEGSTTPGGRAKAVRGPRTREADMKRIGFFTPDEVQKIESFKVNFCSMHGISSSLFDEMVQHSERSQFGEFPVSAEIISKADFWKEIYSLVPDRDRRSVYRFMRRHFQASAQKAHEWTKEQDEELIELYAKHGPKWSYIGKLIGRSDDDVTQRWKNKLEHQDTMNQGAWSVQETKTFLDAVESSWHTMKPTLGEAAGKDFYEMNERLIVWGNISKEMGYTRSRQQCADKWRKIVRQVMIMRANGMPGAVYDPELAAKKTVNWNTRLEGQKKSAQFVKEDSDSDSGEVPVAKMAASSPSKPTPKPTPEPESTAGPSPSREVNVTSDHEVQHEDEPGLPEPPSKSKKSKSKRKRAEEAPPIPTEEAPSAPAHAEKSGEEVARNKEGGEKDRQQQQEQEAQGKAAKAARKEQKRKRKEEKRRRREE
ncbi:hypothetical protein N7535_000941 [Penicillium sp. DV-2018c]|nr:hypothetical protein N7461_005814 [Penicillium sp. DV-2018c]KAJ5582321.1 hypothetical protein N7535_000941 [Penicillium sp. DV-2018c]